MRLFRVGSPGVKRPALLTENGQDSTGRLFDLSVVAVDAGTAFLAGGAGLGLVRATHGQGRLPKIEIGPPIARPGMIMCVRLNCRDRTIGAA